MNFLGRDNRHETRSFIEFGKITDYTSAEMFLRWMVTQYIEKPEGKKRLMKRSSQVVIIVDEPCNSVEEKLFQDMMFMGRYKKGIVFIQPDVMEEILKTMGGDIDEAIWRLEESFGKLDFAIRITKLDLTEYARFSYYIFMEDCKRWKLDPAFFIK